MQIILILLFSLIPTLIYGVIDFEGLLSGIDEVQDPRSATVDGSFTFTSGGVDMIYNRTFDGLGWDGITYSTNTLNAVQSNFSQDQFIAVPGSASSGIGYGVVYPPFGSPATLDFGKLVNPVYMDVTNTLWTYESMLTGSYPGAFPIENGAFADANDFFILEIKGIDAGNTATGTISFELGRGSTLVDTWESVDLGALGTVKALEFSFNTSDLFLANYVAIDNVNFTVVPEPSTYAFLLGCIVVSVAMRRILQ